jgi:hypothetical protein
MAINILCKKDRESFRNAAYLIAKKDDRFSQFEVYEMLRRQDSEGTLTYKQRELLGINRVVLV